MIRLDGYKPSSWLSNQLDFTEFKKLLLTHDSDRKRWWRDEEYYKEILYSKNFQEIFEIGRAHV